MRDKLLLDGKAFQKADLELENSYYNPPKELEMKIEMAWSDLQANRSVWDGTIYRLDSVSKRAGTVLLLLNKIKYRYHVTSHIYGKFLNNYKDATRPNGIYIASYVRTLDNYFLFGQKSKKSILQTRFNLIGGTCNEDEQLISSNEDFFASWKKEMVEELSINEKYIANFEPVGLYETDRYRIAIIFMVDLNLTIEDIKKKVRLNFEHDRLFFIDVNKFFAITDLVCYANIVTSTRPQIIKLLLS